MTGQGEQSLPPEARVKISSLRRFIYGLLVNQEMTNRELVDCLMREPFNIKPDDLGLITLATEGLIEDGFLRINPRVNKGKIESIFTPLSPRG